MPITPIFDLGFNPGATPPPDGGQQASIREMLGFDEHLPSGIGFTMVAHPDGSVSGYPGGVVADSQFALSNIVVAHVGNQVTSLGISAFNNCAIQHITIPDSVVEIGSTAFYYCPFLTVVVLPDSVGSIGSNAFGYCSGLTNISLPEYLPTLESGVFRGCTALYDITIPAGVTHIGSYAFASCINLMSITLPAGMTNIGDFAFGNCAGLSLINILALTAPTLGSDSFAGVAATEVHVPTGATGYGAMYGGLTVVYDL